MLQLGEMQVFGNRAQYPCTGSTAFGNGNAATTPGLTCRTIQLSGNTASGVRWLQPDITMPAFQAFCDQASYGGGWTIGEQWTYANNGNGESYPIAGVTRTRTCTRTRTHTQRPRVRVRTLLHPAT